jgi:hypothetical protein
MLRQFAFELVAVRGAVDVMPPAAYRTLDFAVDDFAENVFIFEIAHPSGPLAPLAGRIRILIFATFLFRSVQMALTVANRAYWRDSFHFIR